MQTALTAWCAVAVLVCSAALNACATGSALRETSAVAIGGDGSSTPYLAALPARKRTPENGWPLIVFLHGRGETGGDLSRVKIHGPIKAAASIPDFGFLVVAPHLTEAGYWQPEAVLAVLDDVEARWPVDSSRIYLTGLSLGGHGTWATLLKSPKRFAAAVPISGRGDPERACELVDLPIWAFHGAVDTVVEAKGSYDMVDAMHACGGNPGLTLYPDTGHDAWARTYADPALYDWLLSHTRSAAGED